MLDEQKPQGDNPTPTSEELKLEEEALKDVRQEDVRASIIDKYGLDEDLQGDLIDKLTADILEQRKSFGKVIGQKRKYRELASKTKPTEEPQGNPQPQPQQPDVGALIDEKLEQDRLESLDLPEDLKPEVQKLAKMQDISVRKAAQDPYILHRKQELEQQKKTEDAAISRSKKGTHVKYDPKNPPKVDMSTEEGRKAWEDWKKGTKPSD